MNEFKYVGAELELFASANNWKNYIKFLLRKYIKGNVLEVGAGIGSNTRLLSSSHYNNWLCLEPDIQLFNQLKDLIALNSITNCYPFNGTIDCLSDQQLFDSILYIDVLEHIHSDREEITKAYQHLKADGNLIILSPAHQWLFTSFDSAIGHYRRYSKKTLKAVMPDELEVIKLAYLDCVGLFASLGNKLVLKQSIPNLKQIKVWDKFMVPISIKIDPLFGYQFGKSILLVGRKRF